MNLSARQASADQAAYWNGAAGRLWADRQEIQDRVMAPVTELLFAAAAIRPGERVVDIGCGCSETAFLAAAEAGPGGFALGVDISELLISRARARAEAARAKVQFRLADAERLDFSAIEADVVISRFGIMFFADPFAAFENLRSALKPGGRLAFVCWRGREFNPWRTIPFDAMRHRVPPQPERGPDDPGPYSLADAARIRRVLEAAGWVDVDMQPHDLEIDTAIGQGLETAVRTALEIGSVAQALDGQAEDVYSAVENDIRAALKPFLRGLSVRLGAGLWLVTARNG